MTRTWYSPAIDIPSTLELVDGQGSKVQVPSNSTEHYVSVPHSDKKSSGWVTVTHHRPRPVRSEAQERRDFMRRMEQQRAYELIMENPVERYHYERDQRVNTTARLMMRDQRYYGWTYRQVRAYVNEWMGRQEEPVILINPKLVENDEIILNKDTQNQNRNRNKLGSRRARTIERRAEAGDHHIKMFDQEFINKVVKARTARKTVDSNGVEHCMTQGDLAKMLNIDVAVIQDLEAGKLQFDGALKSRLILKLGFE